jgi:hypothetical protein
MINCNPNSKNQNRNPEQKVSIHSRYVPSVNNTDWLFIIYNKKAAGNPAALNKINRTTS